MLFPRSNPIDSFFRLGEGILRPIVLRIEFKRLGERSRGFIVLRQSHQSQTQVVMNRCIIGLQARSLAVLANRLAVEMEPGIGLTKIVMSLRILLVLVSCEVFFISFNCFLVSCLRFLFLTHGVISCLLYTSDAADERSSVDL